MALGSALLWNNIIDPAVEPRRIVITRGEFTDPARDNRTVPWKIYAPAEHDGEKFPVIIWSHGLGGSRDGAGFISRFISSHGYIVIHVQHRGTDSSLWEGQPGHPWDAIRRATITRETVLNRYRDVPFVLDQLANASLDIPPMDMNRIGMSGHSFGAGTTQVMAGQRLDEGSGLYDMRDDRFRAGMVYSPMPSSLPNEDRTAIYGDMNIPMFFMTGTDDTSPVEGFGYERRLEVFECSGVAEKILLVLQGGDHMVYNGSRGKLGDNPLRDVHETVVKVASLAWWDAMLKGDDVAKAWLMNGGFAAWLADAGVVSIRA